MPRGPERWTANKLAAQAFGMYFIDSVDLPGLSDSPRRIHQGGNSGYQALGLAHAWGAERVVLLGYDMQRTGGQSHWHGDHKGGLPNLGPALAAWPGRFDAVQRQWPHVINATRQTAITAFPRMSLAAALADVEETVMPLVVHGMHGMGDNLHQRAIVRELMKTRDVWLETPWPSLYHDMAGQRLHLITRGSTLRTQAKNAEREADLYEKRYPPAGSDSLTVSYPPALIRQERGVLAAMSLQCGVPVGDFTMPVPPEWAHGIELPAGRPVIVFRPLVERTEWSGCRNRNPNATAHLAALAAAREALPGAFVVSVADLVPGKEWLTGPQPVCDLELHAGELDFQGLAALWVAASVVVSAPGFGVVLGQAVGTPVICIFGGYEGRYSFDAGAARVPTLAIGMGCDCFSHTHKCVKTDDGLGDVAGFIDRAVNKGMIAA